VNDWSKTLVESTAALEVAVNSISDSSMRIALVVDQEKKLCGTITDGDVRRALLRNMNMKSMVTEIMNPNPIVASSTEDRDVLLAMMRSRDLLHVPIVDNMGRVVGIETLQHLVKNVKHDNPIFLMAGGFGTRLRPLTNDVPKPLLKVGNRPILETILIQFVDAGFHNFFISTHYKAEMIREHFGDGSTWGVKIQYVHEIEPLGTAGALGLLPIKSPGLPILMMNGDLLTKVNFEHLLDFHNEQGGLATMCVREYDVQVPYGVVTIDKQYINTIKEKPIHKFFVNAGIYVIELDLLDELNGSSYLDLPNLFEENLEKGVQINAFPIHEYWLDIGRIEEYERANQEINL
jgi:dTDP-glucose pyrophosphorylase